MDTSVRPITDRPVSHDDRTTGDPWAFGKDARVVLPAARPPGPRYSRLLIAAAVLSTGGAFAIWYALTCTDTAPPEKKDDQTPPLKRTEIKKNLYFEVQGDRRRVIIVGAVCLREGQLEGLMCRKNTKEHEYILAADVDARDIHTALLAAKAVPGTPVQFTPKYVPATGSVIKVSLQYQKDGKLVTVRGQDWIRDMKTGKPMDQEWVFGGSRFIKDPDEPNRPIYLANQGDVICLCNMESAMLDLPVRSPKSLDMRVYDAFTERIPPKDTKVEIIFEVVPEKK